MDLRDALAHGRVSAPEPHADMMLLKFDRPQAGQARVAFAETNTCEWLREQSTRVADEIRRVQRLAPVEKSKRLEGSVLFDGDLLTPVDERCYAKR